MGRKRRKIVRKTIKPPPSIFLCPLCNHEAVLVMREKDSEVAKVVCGFCKASKEVPWYPSYTPVDAYAAWYDIITKEVEGVEAGQG